VTVSVRAAAHALALAVVLGGCGGTTGSAPRAAPVSTAETVEEEESSTGRSGGIGFSVGKDGREQRSPDELYAVFARPATPPERLLARELEADNTFDLREETQVDDAFGNGRFDKLRLLLRAHGIGDLVAVPTTKGGVCWTLQPDGPGGCGRPGPAGLELSYSESDRGLDVFGLVGDEVRSVAFARGGRTEAAQMGENAYALHLPGAFDDLDALVLRLANGDVQRIPLRAQP
jgi:hypothetical protein